MDSTPEQLSEGLSVVRVLGSVLERLVAANSSLESPDSGQITKFHALKAPGIGISQYLERIHKYASCSNECFILALIYIDRLIQGNNFLLTELNVHRVIITSILLAAKFFDDAYYNNAYYAKVGGVLVSEMNRLEVEFLFRLNFSLHVSPELYSKYHAELVTHASGEDCAITPLVMAQQAPITTGPVQAPHQIGHYHPNISEVQPRTQAINTGISTDNCTMQLQQLHNSVPYVFSVPSQITPSPPKVDAQIPLETSQYHVFPSVENMVQVQWHPDCRNNNTSSEQPYMVNKNETNAIVNFSVMDHSLIQAPSQQHFQHMQHPNITHQREAQLVNIIEQHPYGDMVCNQFEDPQNMVCGSYYSMNSSNAHTNYEMPIIYEEYQARAKATTTEMTQNCVPATVGHQHIMYEQDIAPSIQNRSLEMTEGLASQGISHHHLIVGYERFQSRPNEIRIQN